MADSADVNVVMNKREDSESERNDMSQPQLATDDLGHPEAGLKTSDFYNVKNIPERFNHPDWFEGYCTKSQHPFYMTSANTYGSKPPSVHTMPKEFHGRTQKFSETLGKFGMYRNHSLNTAQDRSRV